MVLHVAAAQPTAILLVPGAQTLAAKGEVVVVDDRGLDPGGGCGVELASRGVKRPEVGDEVVGCC